MYDYSHQPTARYEASEEPSSTAAGFAAVAYFATAIMVAWFAFWPDPAPTVNEAGKQLERPAQKTRAAPLPPM